VIVAVGVWLLVVPALTDTLGANPLEKLLHQSGDIAIWTLGAVLVLTPLRVLFPHSRLVNALNRHRRMIGMGACIYGLLHSATFSRKAVGMLCSAASRNHLSGLDSAD
jgi:methionine sulfoxide reductase heme-binding subunit